MPNHKYTAKQKAAYAKKMKAAKKRTFPRSRTKTGKKGKKPQMLMRLNMPNTAKVVFKICKGIVHSALVQVNQEILSLRCFPFDPAVVPGGANNPQYFAEWANFYDSLKCDYVIITGFVRNRTIAEDTRLVQYCDRQTGTYFADTVGWETVCDDPNVNIIKRDLISTENAYQVGMKQHFKYKLAPKRLWNISAKNAGSDWGSFTAVPSNLAIYHLVLFDFHGDVLTSGQLCNISYQVSYHCTMRRRDKSD